ncbi:hypothetical protein A2291_02540 [candidate division WOR-1 bacterium RIFOXYB2_FULL_42_35]|uniref:Pilus assembly protein PilO n=1 Tax=candidate division WOR-1 bacterium RIFOXYC2_FULL_41_25 TaxID=1802586 RepID=A0A1F4TP71_UNCSA|nr:MAG: hypothetical protein A2247_05445 [candidate division WOR-1 bacterium RIFOXYA2_FULL_41_14]OGC25101.1 MAG: hypothetical protein A2291_02540 [candidate division WOR-1 bacterium RIFOXYB2_FULL_42_35]OGC34501.1 MAG: hypothetical protein A2462_04360 [candidate division WOR-1 bacterium RIFOXYC2_FULL_41_25]OGC43228.1 MAG: hypothetical protein A2548_03430 [candidate division WOR-1 bacterium RIFOXYD2_FULL_41_8]
MAGMKMNLNNRDNKILIAGTVFIVMYVSYMFLLGPKWDEISKLKGQLNQAQIRLTADEARVKVLQMLEKKPAGISQKVVSREQWTIRILSYLSSASSQSGLDLMLIKPLAGEGREVQFSLMCSGSYQSLYNFLKVLPKLDVDIIVKSLKISGGGSDRAVLNIDMELGAYY